MHVDAHADRQGRQPREFSAIKLMRAGQFALRWSEQRRELGFG